MSTLAIFGGSPVISPSKPLAKMFVEYPFEDVFCSYVGAKYGITTSNGTSSLITALLGAGIEPGDEIITVSYTWFSTVTSILSLQAIPIFVDIDLDTFTMDPSQIEKNITSRTKAILAVSMYGQAADYEAINQIASKHGLVVIDDACQSVGAAQGHKKLGSIADITAFSFSGKPIVSTGGGIVTTNNQEYYERCVIGGQHPSTISLRVKNEPYWQLASTGGYGYNFRIDGKAAERAYEQLERLDAINNYRRENAHFLSHLLKDFTCIKTPVERVENYHIYHLYTCLFDEVKAGITRDEFVAALNAEGLPAICYVSAVNFLKTPDNKPFAAGPVHRRFLFQQLIDQGKCGPYRIPEYVRPLYKNCHLPQTEKVVNTEFNITQKWLNPPFNKEDMKKYTLAIEKVLAHADEIKKRRSQRERDWQKYTPFLTVHESDA